jgi:hypothetical protein
MITDEYPAADVVCPPPTLLLAGAYNQLREDALRMEKLLTRVANLWVEGVEPSRELLDDISTEARKILNLPY